jgi:hypothetical protein
VIRGEKEKHVLGRFTQEEALHAIDHLASLDISETCPSALGPTAPLNVAKNHFSNMQVPGVLCRPVDVVGRFNEFRSTSIPGETTVNVTCGHIPPLGKSREARPDSSGEEMDLNCFVYLAVQGKQTRIVCTQAVDPKGPRRAGGDISND